VTCIVCHTTDSINEIVTYKSVWVQCDRCNCFSRSKRSRYPLRWLAALVPGWSSQLQALKRLLGSKELGVDYYRYYEEFLARRDLGNWSQDYRLFRERMDSAGVSLAGRALLDVSGEPGLFAAEAQRDGATAVTVTAFADNVAAAITRHLGLRAVAYDFNKDRLGSLLDQRYDFISCRHALGYCEDVSQFFTELRAISAPDACIYIAFSPPSLAVCSRWMFDDYTYLRQYTVEHVLLAAARSGLRCERIFDEGKLSHDHAQHPIQKLLTGVYRHVLCRDLLRGSRYSTHFQHNVGLLLRAGEAQPARGVPAS
jgi:2-polyprenyl-3-methyl-5-hydroxy-6-metoxy-1,4-benzoquinol methylase